MEAARSDRFDIKTRLLKYRDMEREIDNQIERYERLEAKMYGIGSPTISDMPKASTPTGDRMLTQIARREELEKRIRTMVEDHTAEREWIEETVGKMHRADERAVIRMRYLDGDKWTTIAEELFGSREDFDERRESYLRRTTKLHGSALVNMAKKAQE